MQSSSSGSPETIKLLLNFKTDMGKTNMQKD